MSPIDPDAPGALRQVATPAGIRLTTNISWTPPTLDLPDKGGRVLVVLESRPNHIHEAWFDGKRKTFLLLLPHELDDAAHIIPSAVRLWARPTVDQS